MKNTTSVIVFFRPGCKKLLLTLCFSQLSCVFYSLLANSFHRPGLCFLQRYVLFFRHWLCVEKHNYCLVRKQNQCFLDTGCVFYCLVVFFRPGCKKLQRYECVFHNLVCVFYSLVVFFRPGCVFHSLVVFFRHWLCFLFVSCVFQTWLCFLFVKNTTNDLENTTRSIVVFFRPLANCVLFSLVVFFRQLANCVLFSLVVFFTQLANRKHNQVVSCVFQTLVVFSIR